jgi:16S rRNA G527 N7-methylase RsmG
LAWLTSVWCVQMCDLVTARAVAEMPTLAELCLPFVRPGGQLIVAKGATPQVSRHAW